MQIKTFRQKLVDQGINITEKALADYLNDLGLNDVPANMVNDLTADLKAKYATALDLVGQGKGELKGVEKPAAPAPQAPQQQQEVNFQPITSTIHTTVEQIVRANHQGEQDAIAAVSSYLKGSPDRIVEGVNQQLATVNVSGSLDGMLRKQRDAWASTNNAIADIINSVNTAAGVSRDAAA